MGLTEVLIFSEIVFGPPTSAVPSTRITVSSTKVLSLVVGVLVRACSFIVLTGMSLVLIYLVLYLIVALGQYCTTEGRVVVEVLVELVEDEVLVVDRLVELLVEDIDVDVLCEVEVLDEVELVEVVVVKNAAAISFQTTLVVQVMGDVSLAAEDGLYSAAITPLALISV